MKDEQQAFLGPERISPAQWVRELPTAVVIGVSLVVVMLGAAVIGIMSLPLVLIAVGIIGLRKNGI